MQWSITNCLFGWKESNGKWTISDDRFKSKTRSLVTCLTSTIPYCIDTGNG